MRRMKNIMMRTSDLLLIVLALALFSSSCLAEAFIRIDPYTIPGDGSLGDISVIEYNDFYVERDGSGFLDETGYSVTAILGSKTENYNVLAVSLMISLEADEYHLTLKDAVGEVKDERSIVFCDHDSICEPCIEGICYLIENSASCDDCMSGSDDGFCDTSADSICDPDCEGDYTDPDCCPGGVCMPIGEYVETASQMNAQPSMTITPSGEFASTVLGIGIREYCPERLDGSICLGDQYCDGESVEYYLGWHCCLGTCRLLPEEILSKYDYDNPETSPDGMFEEDWEYSELAVEEEQPAIDEQFTPEGLEADEEGKTTVDYVSDAVETVSGRISWLYVAGIVLGILMLVTLLLALFRRKAGQDMKESERQIQKEAEGPVNLQQQIDSMVSKGMNYNQIKEHLIRQGNPPMVVSAEIQRNYSRRSQTGR